MKRYIKYISLLLVFTLLLPMAACGKEEEAEEEQVVIELADTVSGKTLTAGPAADEIFSLSADFDESLNPLRTKSSANLMVAGLVYDNLFEVDAAYNLSSRLVESWECNEEGNFFTIRIKSGIPMHDGSTLTAYDVGYSSSLGERIPYDELQRGDIVCFNTISDSDLSDHVGIYLGDNKFVHCSSATKKVTVSEIESYYKRKYTGARRVADVNLSIIDRFTTFAGSFMPAGTSEQENAE